MVSIDKYALKNDFSKYITKKSVDNARDRFLTKEEIQRLYKYFEDEPTMILFLKIALTAGARLNSILYIKKKDLDLNHNLIKLKDFKNNTT